MGKMHEDTDWQRLGEAIRARREELLLSQAEAVRRSEGLISLPTWSLLENARQQRYKRRTLQGAALALGWPRDGCYRVLDGDDPGTFGARASAPGAGGGATISIEVPTAIARRISLLSNDERARMLAVLDALLPADPAGP